MKYSKNILKTSAILTWIAFMASSFTPSFAETADSADTMPAEKKNTSSTLKMEMDSYWGFTTHGHGFLEIADKVNLVPYAKLWGNPLWVEGGVGLHYVAPYVDIIVSIGAVNGTFTSRKTIANIRIENYTSENGTAVQEYRLNLVDALAPSMQVEFQEHGIEGKVLGTYYIGMRDTLDNIRNNYLYYLARFGYQVFPKVILGAHWEQLIHTHGTSNGEVNAIYGFLGGYTEFKINQSFSVALAAGGNLKKNANLDFYRLGFNIHF